MRFKKEEDVIYKGDRGVVISVSEGHCCPDIYDILLKNGRLVKGVPENDEGLSKVTSPKEEFKVRNIFEGRGGISEVEYNETVARFKPKPKVVIFNAPKNTGKDFFIEACSDMLEHRAFKTKLYELTADFYGIETEHLINLATDRILKEETMSLFLGKSPRQALIHVSEDITKPKIGNDYFGKALVESLEDGGIYGVSDSGFQEEYDTVVEGVGAENVLLIRMFSQDSTFEGDSRSYVEYPRGASVVNFFNDKTERSVEEIRDLVRVWLLL